MKMSIAAKEDRVGDVGRLRTPQVWQGSWVAIMQEYGL